LIGIKDIVKPFGTQSFLIGLGVAAVGYMLAPQLKKTFQPIIDKGTQGAMALSSKTKQFWEDSREKVTARGEKSDRSLESLMQVMQNSEQQREMSNQIMMDLKDAVMGLKDEISRLKENFPAGSQ